MNQQTARTTVLARFAVRLNLPEGEQQDVDDAAEAVGQNTAVPPAGNGCVAGKVAPLSDEPGENIFILEVGHSVQFDWTWEGAVAFRPADIDSFQGNVDATDDFVDVDSVNGRPNAQRAIWSGEVVEVDETNGRLFVSVSGPDFPPFIGSFYVRPFEFLAFLHSVFCQSDAGFNQRLAPRLKATCGGVHPSTSGVSASSPDDVKHLWGHSWGILWGPPGTGKTYTLAHQVASYVNDPRERILVLSTTNRATDAAALATGMAARLVSPGSVADGRILRLGSGADWADYQAQSLEGLLRGTQTDLLRQIGALNRQLQRAKTYEQRAEIRNQIKELRRSMKESAFNIFVCPDARIVIATAFKATTLLDDPSVRSMVAADESAFTTVVIDEAGLMSRAVVAALSLLAARRVLVVGDGKQLAPISKVSRILPPGQAMWLASSCLTHLQGVTQVGRGVHLLREQHRMHPHISRAVSHYQYDGALQDAPSALTRRSSLPSPLNTQPRAIWYVLDEEYDELPAIRAERGSGNRSWIRPCTHKLLEKLFAHTGIHQAKGLFITPFRAQSREIVGFFAKEHLEDWSAGTVHSRQGTEADVVIFDTVNAGSTGWPYDEWKRLVNVALSRSEELLIVLASRAEMNEPYLRPLMDVLAPRTLKWSGRSWSWVEVSVTAPPTVSPVIADNPCLLGNQLACRKLLRPVMSKEQQQLCALKMDGKPRLVRGLAGSGKTYVLAHWLQKTVRNLSDRPDAKIWAVYANRSLQRLISDTIEESWRADGCIGRSPMERVEMVYIKNLLGILLQEAGVWWRGDQFDYNGQAAAYLRQRPFEQIKSRCHAMFIDEAQDMGEDTLKLLTALIEPTDPADLKSRAVNIFYDDAQNIYGRKRPTWSDMGLDMRGRRSTIMKESFRSTRPIAEFALNVLYRLCPPTSDDHKELVKLGLIEQTRRGGQPWWNVRFNQVEGPNPVYKKYPSLSQQVTAIADYVLRWIVDEGVRPCDICVLCLDNAFRVHIEQELGPRLNAIKARLVCDPGQGEAREPNSVIVCTSAGFKGYEAEVVVIGGLERFTAQRQILPSNLYVAMTRARSMLAIFAYEQGRPKLEAATLLSTVEQCLDALLEKRAVERDISMLDDFEDILSQLGAGKDKKEWLEKVCKSYLIHQEPITAGDGEILADPLFWFQVDDRVFACFGEQEPRTHVLHKLEDNRIELIRPGQAVPGGGG